MEVSNEGRKAKHRTKRGKGPTLGQPNAFKRQHYTNQAES